MEMVTLFTKGGEVEFSLPMINGADRILLELIRLTALKNGFDEERSEQIASTFCDPILEKIPAQTENSSPKLDLHLIHQNGQLRIVCTLSLMGLLQDRTYTV
jgi:hypothetical protein